MDIFIKFSVVFLGQENTVWKWDDPNPPPPHPRGALALCGHSAVGKPLEDLPIFPSFERKMEVMGPMGLPNFPSLPCFFWERKLQPLSFHFLLGGRGEGEHDQIFLYSSEATWFFGFGLALGKGDLNNPVDLGF